MPPAHERSDPATRRGGHLLTFALIALLAAGAFLRFHHLDRKIYWNDEVWTSLWLSGHRGGELVDRLFDGRELSVATLQHTQRLDPARGWTATLAAVAADDPKQGPFYYVIARGWVALFGDSVSALRSLSAWISLLAFPALYWLCRELFAEARTAWLALALLAVSPFHLLYAQEARPYSLWTVTILVASAALLHALRRPALRHWSLYALCVATGLYTHSLFALIVLAHAACALTLDRRRLMVPGTLRAYEWSTAAALAAWLPWVVVIVGRAERVVANSGWVFLWDGVPALLQRWFVAFTSPFFDLDRGALDPLSLAIGGGVLLLGILALRDLRRAVPIQPWLFVAPLMATPALALMLPDLLLGGRLISAPRFLIPCYLGLLLAVARLLSVRAFDPGSPHRMLWRAVPTGLIVGGVVSAAASAEAETWWNKSFSGHNLTAARIINQAAHPLLISDASGSNPRNVISLSYRLAPDVRIRLFDERRAFTVPDLDGDVFLFNASAPTRRAIEAKGYRIEEIDRSGGLSRVAR